MRPYLTFIVLLISSYSLGQGNSFPFGQVMLGQLQLKKYERDSTAAAVVLKEFGESFISEEGKGLIFDHHYIIKILKPEGLKEANLEIPLYKSDGRSQKIISLKASSYNLENGSIQETRANTKNIFTESVNKYWDEKKLTIPNVRVGSVIEIQYTLEDPFFVMNFRPWSFQGHIPKVSSEYWATIPANYEYNITWKGYLKFKRNEGKLLKECFDLGGPYKADCGRYFFLIENVPAFTEEEYMTAKSNFIASVNFELSVMRRFDGKVERFTREWKDADSEIVNHEDLGDQLKKGKEILQKIQPTLVGVTDPTEKARKIYSFINTWYRWDEYVGIFSNDGIKKAFDAKTGSVGDINLSLMAALRAAGLNVEPLLLSTRANGSPTELHPVLTDFNYIIAKLTIGDKVYLLDATDPWLPFGMLPLRCLNGQGRAFPDKQPSYWYDLKSIERDKTVSMLDLTIQPSGKITGTIEFNRSGYNAYTTRKKIKSYESIDKFVEEVNKGWNSVTILKSEITGVDSIGSNIKEKYTVEIEGFDDMNAGNLLLNPFFTGKIDNNPFRLSERLFPVDFGSPPEMMVNLNLTYPKTIALVSKPERNAFGLPGGAGKFLFDMNEGENKLVMNYVLSINKPLFNSNEYAALKEMYNRVVQTQNTDLIFQKKK